MMQLFKQLLLVSSWPHVVSCLTILFAVLLGMFRLILIEPLDPLHCSSLMNRGGWLDSRFKNWQPEGCMMHKYAGTDAAHCLKSRQVIFIGDSVTRKLFFQFSNIVDAALPTAAEDGMTKHADHHLTSKSGVEILFLWDPYLNSSKTISTIEQTPNQSQMPISTRPALLVLGSGLWYLRYADSGGLPTWEITMESIFTSLRKGKYTSADEIIILPVEDVITNKLNKARATTITPSDIDAMNAELKRRIHSLKDVSYRTWLPFGSHAASVSSPQVFNLMLDAGQTDDGLHFSDSLVRGQANVLMNYRCNNILPKKFPLDKTCCRSYPRLRLMQIIIVTATILWGPIVWYKGGLQPLKMKSADFPAVTISASIALAFAADRTNLWFKEQKQFDITVFAFLCGASLIAGIWTATRSDSDLGFLNRHQTDEWKGWMQVAILIYHYLGASKISGIYNPIRVLVAGYLFMTGFGHTMFYIQKANYSFSRVAQILVRINLFTILLAYTMNTDYITYYFSPLVSMWFIIVYSTLAIGFHHNDKLLFVVGKIMVSMALMTWFMHNPRLLEFIFHIFQSTCGIHWSAQEWAFRVNLDLYIVYYGMIFAIAVLKIKEHRLTESKHWPTCTRLAAPLSAIIILWYFNFELGQESKFTYNKWHPYISFLPITAFVLLRNATGVLRSTYSRAFAFIGKCSLETFIIQYHLWLGADTKGLLMVISGTRWRFLNFAITTVMFIYVSHHVSEATAVITGWICKGQEAARAPRPTNIAPDMPVAAATATAIEASETLQNKAEVGLVEGIEPDTFELKEVDEQTLPHPATSDPGTSFSDHWSPGVKTKLGIGLFFMWIANILWSKT